MVEKIKNSSSVNGKVIVKAIAVRDGNNVTMHVPSFKLINELIEDNKKQGLTKK